MRKVFSLLLVIAMAIFLCCCGSEKEPSGGPKDTVKPELVNVDPGEFESISGGRIEVTFSKPIDRATILTGIHIYPTILQKKYRWTDDNTVQIRIYERLEENTNYYLMFSQNIKGMHGNTLDKDYLFTFASGELQRMRLSGDIEYESAADAGKDIQFSLFDADTVNVFKQVITGDNYILDNLNPGKYIIESYIDLTGNNSYNYGEEPYFRSEVELEKNQVLTWQMAYEDSLAPSLRDVKTLSGTQLIAFFSEVPKSIGSIRITAQDSLNSELPIIQYNVFEDTLHILTAVHDTLKYKLDIRNLVDFKENYSEIDSIFYQGVAHADTTAPRVLYTVPRNGTSIETRMPDIEIKFSEMILSDNIDLTMRSVETGESIGVEIVEGNSSRFVLRPESTLTNYNTYVLTIGKKTCDPAGNPMRESVDISMIPIVREE